MKTRLGVCLCLALATVAPAQEPPPIVVGAESPLRTEEQLDQLFAPIALYPDALVALILPAAAAPVDIVLAARYLREGGDPNAASSRAWDESVKSLAHYPDVVKWMDDNIEWTKQVGDAFLRQPTDVMKSIQRLREQARAAGALTTTPQQVVAYDSGAITIVPAQPDVIYVPRYVPDYVFGWQPSYYYSSYAQPFISFGVGFAVGPWLTHDCDWRSRRIWVVNRHWNWRDHRDWRHPVFPGQAGYVATPYRQPWTPPPNVVRPPVVVWRGRDLYRPTPIAGAPGQTFAAQNPATTPIANTPQPPGRERGLVAPRRVDSAVVNNSPQPAPQQVSPTAPPTINMRPRYDASASERRIHMNPTVAVTRPAPSAVAAAPAQSFANTPERSFPYNTAPTTPVVAPITGPLVTPLAPAPAPHPQIAFPAATSVPQPAPAHPRISMSPAPAPAAAVQAPPPATHRAPPPQPQTQPPPQQAPRDDRDGRRKPEQP